MQSWSEIPFVLVFTVAILSRNQSLLDAQRIHKNPALKFRYDHSTMQKDVLLHFWVMFLYWNQSCFIVYSYRKQYCCKALELFHCLLLHFYCLLLLSLSTLRYLIQGGPRLYFWKKNPTVSLFLMQKIKNPIFFTTVKE